MRSSETRLKAFANWTVVPVVALALLVACSSCKSKPEPIDEAEPTLEVEPDRHSTNWRSRPIEQHPRDAAQTTTSTTNAASSSSASASGSSGSARSGSASSPGGTGGTGGSGGGGNPLLEISSTSRSSGQSRDGARNSGTGSTLATRETTESSESGGDTETASARDAAETTGGESTASTRQTWSDLLQVSDEMVDAQLPAPPPEIESSLAVLDALALPDGDRRRDFIGVWMQTGGGNAADFFVGGQRSTLLVFRTDGLCDVIRSFDEAGTVRVARRFDYLVESDGTVVFGSDPKRRPALDRRERSVPLPGGGTATVRPPAKPLPVRLESQIEGAELTLDGRRYRRIDQAR